MTTNGRLNEKNAYRHVLVAHYRTLAISSRLDMQQVPASPSVRMLELLGGYQRTDMAPFGDWLYNRKGRKSNAVGRIRDEIKKVTAAMKESSETADFQKTDLTRKMIRGEIPNEEAIRLVDEIEVTQASNLENLMYKHETLMGQIDEEMIVGNMMAPQPVRRFMYLAQKVGSGDPTQAEMDELVAMTKMGYGAVGWGARTAYPIGAAATEYIPQAINAISNLPF